MDHCICDPQPFGFGHLFNAVRMEIACVSPPCIFKIPTSGKSIIDNTNQPVISTIEKNAAAPEGRRFSPANSLDFFCS
ncbi:MAG: hypothetical protein EHM30_07850 [Desulfobacteraceae bacterium]|nr:MAG: hypothetical protein EHM30_07850 [Desulfobacteraceae bacterium]